MLLCKGLPLICSALVAVTLSLAAIGECGVRANACLPSPHDSDLFHGEGTINDECCAAAMPHYSSRPQVFHLMARLLGLLYFICVS